MTFQVTKKKRHHRYVDPTAVSILLLPFLRERGKGGLGSNWAAKRRRAFYLATGRRALGTIKGFSDVEMKSSQIF